MTRQDQRIPVLRAEGARRALSVRVPGRASQLAVGDDLAVRHLAKGPRDRVLEGAQPVEIELDVVERDTVAREVVLQPVDESTHIRGGPVTDRSGLGRYRRPQREAGVNPTRVGVWRCRL